MHTDRADISIAGGVHCAEFIAGDKHITYNFGMIDIDSIVVKILEALSAGATLTCDRDGSHSATWAEKSLVFHPKASQTLITSMRNRRAYLLGLILVNEHLIWEKDYIPLKAGVMESKTSPSNLDIPLAYLAVRPAASRPGMDSQDSPEDLDDIADMLDRSNSFVIVGESGSGKTTTLNRIAHDLALDCLKGSSQLIPLVVNLSQQKNQTPFEFLENTWQQHVETPFADALSGGEVLLLLDGLDEMPHDNAENQRLKDWRLFVETYANKNKIVFTCREQDPVVYLNLPWVIIRRLEESRIVDFLNRISLDGLLSALQEASPDERHRLKELVENPLYLNMLVHYFRNNQSSLDNRGRLLAWFTNALIGREKVYHLENNPSRLPDEVRVSILARLAYAIQENNLGTDIPVQALKNLLPAGVRYQGKYFQVDWEEQIRFAEGAGILDSKFKEDIRFRHRLLQESFASRELLRRFNRSRASSTLREKPDSFEIDFRNENREQDALPFPSAEGWEMTYLLASGMSEDAGLFIEGILEAPDLSNRPMMNLVLAGKCLAEAGVHLVDRKTRTKILKALSETSLDRQLPPAVQRDAGFVLGYLGQSRSDFLASIRPNLDEMSAALIPEFEGSESDREITAPAFYLGKYPVTNMQFRRFMEDGGYIKEEFWSKDGWDWRNGRYLSRADRGLKDWMRLHPPEKRFEPVYWYDPHWNNPLAPVVSICWFEAEAYCNWLAKKNGIPVRLPTDHEWERAASGMRISEVGPLATSLNCREFWREEKPKSTTLVGQFPESQTPDGIQDLYGNVWEWTSSLDEPERTKYIVRGGSWADSLEIIKSGARYRYLPDDLNVFIGFRICCPDIHNTNY